MRDVCVREHVEILLSLWYKFSMSPIPYIPDRKVLANHILFDANEHYSQWVKVPISGVTNLNRYPDQHSTR